MYQTVPIASILSYNKREKLKSRKQIALLFSSGKVISLFPFRVLYAFADESPELLQAGVTVSSRNFKKAVDRNRVKRVTRETYRLNKALLSEALALHERKMILFIIYTGKELPVFHEVSGKMFTILEKLAKETEKQGRV